MALPKWKELIKQPVYDQLSLEEKLAERERYFTRLVAEQGSGLSAEQINSEKKGFIQHTEDIDPVFKSAPREVKSVEEMQRPGDYFVHPNGATEVLDEKRVINNELLESFRQGIEASSTALLFGAKPSKEYQPEGFAQRIAYQYGTLSGDAPAMGLGALIGGESPITALAGAFAVPAAIKAVMKEKEKRGEINRDNVEKVFENALIEAGKSWLTGASVGTAAKVAPFGLKTLSEIGTMVGVSSAIEGQVPTKEDFLDAAAVITGLKVLKNARPLSQKIVNEMKARKAMRSQGEKIADDMITKSRNGMIDTEYKFKQPVIPPMKEQPGTGALVPEVVEGWTPEIAQNIKDMEIVLKGAKKQFAEPIEKLVKGDPSIGNGDLTVLEHQIKFENPTMPRRTNEHQVFVEAPRNVRFNFFGKWLDTANRIFSKYDPKDNGIKKLLFESQRDATRNMQGELLDAIKDINSLKDVLNLNRRNSDRIGVFAIKEQEGGLKTLRNMKKTYQEHGRLIEGAEFLNDKEIRAYEFMRNKYSEFYYRLNAARKLAGQKLFPEVENYFTFMRNARLLSEEGYDLTNDKLGKVRIKDVNGNDVMTNIVDNIGKLELAKDMFIHPRGTIFEFAKERTKGSIAPLDINSFEVFRTYTESALKHIHMAPVIGKLRQMTNMATLPDGTKFELAKENPNLYTFLREWGDTVVGKKDPTPVYKVTALTRRVLHTLNKNLIFSSLSYNFRTIMVQPAAYVNSIVELNPRWAGIGISKVADPVQRKFAMDNSRVLMGREFDIGIRAMNEGIAAKYAHIRDQIGDFGIKPIQMLDMLTATATWLGAYERALKHRNLKMDHRDAVVYADDVVTRTQGSANPADISRIQRNILGRTLTQFQTFSINQFGFLTRDLMGIGMPKKPTTAQKIANAATWLGVSALTNSFYQDVLGINSPLPSPITEYNKEIAEGKPQNEAIRKALLEVSEIIPGLGAAKYGSSPFGPFAELAGKVTKKIATGAGPTTAEIIARLAGVPGVTTIKKMIKEENKFGVKKF